MEHEHLVIEDGVVTGFKDGVDKASITDIEIPEGVTHIEDYAFEGCINLKSVTIPEGVTQISAETFWECKIESVTLPASIEAIWCDALQGCKTVTYDGTLAQWCAVDGYIEFMDEAESVVLAGEDNMDLKKVTMLEIPDGVRRIGEGAFGGCKSLERVTMSEWARVKIIGPGAFYGCTNLTRVEIPEDVTEIDNCAFQGCTSLTCVEIPEDVTRIGESAFFLCESLESVSYSGMMEQWEEIEKSGWRGEDEGGLVIHCMDGDITTE